MLSLRSGQRVVFDILVGERKVGVGSGSILRKDFKGNWMVDTDSPLPKSGRIANIQPASTTITPYPPRS